MGYPPPPSYAAPGYQPTLPGLFGYSRPGSPTMNPMYPYSNASFKKKIKNFISFYNLRCFFSLILIILDII